MQLSILFRQLIPKFEFIQKFVKVTFNRRCCLLPSHLIYEHKAFFKFRLFKSEMFRDMSY